jgi:hypothetical protein
MDFSDWRLSNAWSGVEAVEVGWPRMLLCLLDCFLLVVIPS